MTHALALQTQDVAQTPATIMAAQVRAALAEPSDPTAWTAVEASARGLSAAGDATVGPTASTAGWLDQVQSLFAGLTDLTGANAVDVLLGLAIVIGAVLVGRHALVWLRKEARRGEPVSRIVSTDVSAGRGWTLTVLAEQGMPGSEISRRTGMGRDAVRLALARSEPARTGAVRRSA